jgi:hypothetical protein
MKVTNHTGIPDVFENYSRREAYDAGFCDFTPSSLAEPAMITHLTALHAEHITVDIADSIMAIMGTAMHSILEKGANAEDLVEHRMFHDYGEYIISGCADRIVPGNKQDPYMGTWKIQDYKSTSASTIVHNPDGKPEWVAQQSIYAWLARRNEVDVDEAEVVAMIRDFTKSQAVYQKSKGYPQAAVVVIPLELWSDEQTEQYMRTRIAALTAVEPAPCTKEERWQGDTKYAVKKYVSGGSLAKRASRVLDSSYDAEEYMLDQGIHGEVEVRPGTPNRCKDWCPVSGWCKQYQDEVNEEEDIL